MKPALELRLEKLFKSQAYINASVAINNAHEVGNTSVIVPNVKDCEYTALYRYLTSLGYQVSGVGSDEMLISWSQ